MGRAESREGKMSTQDPSDLWSRLDGEAELLQDLGWYHGNLTRHAAEALLLSNGCDGSYLLRDSNEMTGLYSLSVRAKDSVKHFHVEYTGYSFKFGFNEFSSLKDFVKHFANQPLIGSETGTLIVLKHPYPRKVEEPSIYESVRVHTAMQTGRTENDLVLTAPSTWKTRWFTLHRNELKYFKDQMSPEPIRSLDLTECSAVQFDYSQERVNCFCLVFPFRTFYLCAKTGVEADEWIKILRWKLVSDSCLWIPSTQKSHVDDFEQISIERVRQPPRTDGRSTCRLMEESVHSSGV
ncbi:dual adapter for phosphotyrosine and 3-phosphotyrosine and 3-phosphoinositide isoform X2 [Physeter macrocephalus]|uniref:Dual adapter for phosphotyrosine and 3-phosphotyrosine and 3-phosphoinositide isoform X2 n=1 Tax=Physeter macrocephalus TaxID=9755 RepID=A0A455BUG8_PHYMC|nr:dual adapter for phosphotyrosine and 3-phosphotyrosine and 3-phosphoinositide isoform X2 [Physeter catodon]|eukprot:XP_028347481.1 dual adapter for phosphotyrosine and 3-phosphotyrosine and 3-phosphoinositide isoform X2 [Physeter catodon]